jgi:hypothetical protein
VEEVLRVGKSNDVTVAFRDYFVRNKGLFDFERDLKIYGIGHQKIAFY